MKVVYTVYHDCNKEERSKEILTCCEILGEVHFVSYAEPNEYNKRSTKIHLIDKKSPIALLHFIFKAKQVIKKEMPDIVVLHDCDCSVLLPYVKKVSPHSKIVYDSSELEIPMKNTKPYRRNNGILIRIKSALTAFRVRYEKKYLKLSDVVIAANIERAKIMKDYFGLKSIPIVFDNMHKIKDDYELSECDKKYGFLSADGKFNILFAGGIDEERQTFDFVNAVLSLNDSFRLIVVGSASAVAIKKFNNIIRNSNAENKIVYLGMVPRRELKYLIQHSQTSVVVFDKNSYNTLYCASGKLYESLFEGCPILCSENPPLKRICESCGVGVSTDNFSMGIEKIKNNYDIYRLNVDKYISNLKYDERVSILTDLIRREIL